MQAERPAVIEWAVHLQLRWVWQRHRLSHWRKINRCKKNWASHKRLPRCFQWLTFPQTHSCSCCPRWTRGWLDGRSGWAFPQPAPFLCSSGWLPWVSDHPHLGTKGEKRQSAIALSAFCSSRVKEKQGRSFRSPARQAGSHAALCSHAGFCFSALLQQQLPASSGANPEIQQARAQQILQIHTPPYLLQAFVPINYASSAGAHRHASWLCA